MILNYLSYFFPVIFFVSSWSISSEINFLLKRKSFWACFHLHHGNQGHFVLCKPASPLGANGYKKRDLSVRAQVPTGPQLNAKATQRQHHLRCKNTTVTKELFALSTAIVLSPKPAEQKNQNQYKSRKPILSPLLSFSLSVADVLYF